MSSLDHNKASRVSVYPVAPNQHIPFNVSTRIMFNGVLFDSLDEFDIVNYWFQPRRAGYYQVNLGLMWNVSGGGLGLNAQVAIEPYGGYLPTWDNNLENAGWPPTHNASTIVYLTPNNRLAAYAYNAVALGLDVLAGQNATHLSIHRLS